MSEDPLVEAVLEPMRQLLRRYEKVSAVVASAVEALAEQVSMAGSAAAESQQSAPGGSRPVMATLEVQGGDVPGLLTFQERLSQLSGVESVALAGVRDGSARFLLTLTSETPRVLCVSCGKTLSEGALPASHGLCSDCGATYGSPLR